MIDSRAQLYLGHIFLLSSLRAFSANWDCESLNGASTSFFRVSSLVSVVGVSLTGSVTYGSIEMFDIDRGDGAGGGAVQHR